MIYSNSRYAGQTVLQLLFSDGKTYPTVFRQQPPLGLSNYLHYTVTAGDRFDTLAYKFFGDPTLWWMIADCNPEIFFPSLSTANAGSVIRIPQP